MILNKNAVLSAKYSNIKAKEDKKRSSGFLETHRKINIKS